MVPVAHKQSEDFVSLVEMFKETAFCEFFSSIRDGAGRIRVSVGDDQSVAYRGDGRGLVLVTERLEAVVLGGERPDGAVSVGVA